MTTENPISWGKRPLDGGQPPHRSASPRRVRFGSGPPDFCPCTLKVPRSAVGSGSGRPEPARPMSRLGRKRPFPIKSVIKNKTAESKGRGCRIVTGPFRSVHRPGRRVVGKPLDARRNLLLSSLFRSAILGSRPPGIRRMLVRLVTRRSPKPLFANQV
jgi:hypothetical protein